MMQYKSNTTVKLLFHLSLATVYHLHVLLTKAPAGLSTVASNFIFYNVLALCAWTPFFQLLKTTRICLFNIS